APLARPVEQQHLRGFLRLRPTEVLLDEVGRERRAARAAGAGDARTVREEQPIGNDVMGGESLAKILIVIPVHTGAAAFHQPRPAENEATGADADERGMGCADLAQIADSRLV